MDAGLGTHASTAEVEPDRHAIAAELGRRGIDLAFASLLEATFEAATSAARTRHLIISGVLAMVLSNLFLVADARLVPDVFGYSILLHVVCTVIYSLALFYTARTPPANLREAAHGTCLTMGLLGTIGLVSLSGAPDRGYLVGTYVLFIVYANVVIRLRFIWCVTFNATGTLAATAAALTFQGLPEGARVLMPLSVLTAAAYTLYANYTIEAGERRAFLLALDQRLAAAELALLNTRLNSLSTTDWLTDVANRRGLEDYLSQAFSNAAAMQQPLALLMIDVDHFKLFNDRHGHPAGDACLRRLARLIAQLLRQDTDRLGRYGGEEFAVVLPNTTQPDAILAAERIRSHVEDLMLPHGAPGAGPVVTVSIGVCALCPTPGDTAEQLIAAADAALYESKMAGRNRVHPPVTEFLSREDVLL